MRVGRLIPGDGGEAVVYVLFCTAHDAIGWCRRDRELWLTGGALLCLSKEAAVVCRYRDMGLRRYVRLHKSEYELIHH